MKKKKTWGQKFLTFLWWICIPLPLFALWRWIMATWFLWCHRFFRSSTGVREKIRAAHDKFFDYRREIIIDQYSDNVYYLMLVIWEHQSGRYVSLETLQAMQALYVMDDQTLFDLIDVGEYHLIDQEGIEYAFGLKFKEHHESTIRDKKIEALIRRTYRDDDEPMPPSMAIGDLILDQMKAEVACTPTTERQEFKGVEFH